MDELIAFLRAQLDEDERVAREATAGPWRYDPTKHHREPGTVRFSEGVFTGPAGRDATCVAVTGETDDPQSMADGEHIAHWDPARVLAEVEAKRRVLALTIDLQEREGRYAEGFLVALAQPYAGRPGWDARWTL